MTYISASSGVGAKQAWELDGSMQKLTYTELLAAAVLTFRDFSRGPACSEDIHKSNMSHPPKNGRQQWYLPSI